MCACARSCVGDVRHYACVLCVQVQYFIVPDAWASDPAFVDRVVEGMGLKLPNMVLNFNPIKQPISRYNLKCTPVRERVCRLT